MALGLYGMCRNCEKCINVLMKINYVFRVMLPSRELGEALIQGNLAPNEALKVEIQQPPTHAASTVRYATAIKACLFFLLVYRVKTCG